jgi:tetratricopeptide (TPR) repeat protein
VGGGAGADRGGLAGGQTLGHCHSIGDVWGEAMVHHLRGVLAWCQGNPNQAVEAFREASRLFLSEGDRLIVQYVYDYLARALHDRGDYDQAQAVLAENLDFCRGLDLTRGMGLSLTGLANVARSRGDYQLARAHFQQALVLLRDVGDRQNTAWCLEGRAHLAAAEAQPALAARLFGAADALRDVIRAPIPPSARARRDEAIAHLRATLGEETCADAWTEGAALTFDEAATLALGPSPSLSHR